MKKGLRNIKRAAAIFGAFLVIGVVITYIYHQYKLNLEAELLNHSGTLVEVGNKEIHVYNEGEGKDTFVFMPGAGITAPVYEMKGLYTRFSKEHKIAVVERAGYGFSDVFHDERDIDTILKQTRQALRKSGNKPPYILVPHSISGLEAIYWAQKYPDEVKGIIAMDVGLPSEYAENPLDSGDILMIKGLNILSKLGMQRLSPNATYDPKVIEGSFLSEKEKGVFKALSYQKAFNDDIEQEILQASENASASISLPAPYNTPILFLSAYTKENQKSEGIIRKNKHYKEFASKLKKSDVKRVKGKHSIYLYAPDEIYQLSEEFIYGHRDRKDER
ncbi:alpha/beta hydrolase [Bacillus massilinigeriensis]|uniref:alpha/beta hydrolase n=1 Tax=Bacillus mediterraneensis TaxID=1805474 RepID=UPI0008F925CB|nr:alpha/beta hydrolase [Bacillus mediterraneensis]